MLSDRIFHFKAVDSAIAAAAVAAAAAVTFGAFFAAHHAAEARIRIRIHCPGCPPPLLHLCHSICSSVCLFFLQSAAAAAGAVIQVNAAFIHISKRIIPDVFHQNISKIMLIPYGRLPLNK